MLKAFLLPILTCLYLNDSLYVLSGDNAEKFVLKTSPSLSNNEAPSPSEESVEIFAEVKVIERRDRSVERVFPLLKGNQVRTIYEVGVIAIEDQEAEADRSVIGAPGVGDTDHVKLSPIAGMELDSP